MRFILMILVGLVVAAPASAGESCGDSGSVDCCTLGGIFEDDADLDDYDIINPSMIYQEPVTSDVAPDVISCHAGNAYTQASVETTGADFLITGGIGTKKITVVQATSDTSTLTFQVTIEGTQTNTTITMVSGAPGAGEVQCITSDAVCATALETYLDANITGFTATAVSDVVWLNPTKAAQILGLSSANGGGTKFVVVNGDPGSVIPYLLDLDGRKLIVSADGADWIFESANGIAIFTNNGQAIHFGATTITSSDPIDMNGNRIHDTTRSTAIGNECAAAGSAGNACTGGIFTGAQLHAGGKVIAGAAYSFQLSGRSQLLSSADKKMRVSDAASTDLDQMTWGAETNQFPAIYPDGSASAKFAGGAAVTDVVDYAFTGTHTYYGAASQFENVDAQTVYDTDWQLVYTAGDWITGTAMSGVTFQDGATGAITVFADAGGGQVTVTSAGHGLLDGEMVSITNTADTEYQGVFEVQNKATDTFEITATWDDDDAQGQWVRGGNLAVTYAGVYELNYTLSSTPANANDVIDIVLFAGFTAGVADQIGSTETRVEMAGVGKYNNWSGGGIISLSAGDIVSIGVKNTTGANDMTTRYVNIWLHKL